MRVLEQVGAEVRDASVVAGGVRMHYRTAGCGPALVLVHGLVGSAKNWEQNINELAQDATVYALDLANMGESERVAGLDAGLEATADRVADFMDALGVHAGDVAGHSHGGAVVMMLAARHPEKVRRLVLFAPANPFCELGKGLIKFYNSRIGNWFAHRIPRLPRLAHDVAHRRMYVDKRCVTPEMLDGYTNGLNRESIEHMLGILRRWWDDMGVLRGLLEKVAVVPTLLIWGDQDFAVGVGSGRRLAEALGAQMLVIPGVGHLPFAERPDVCNPAVRDWLRG
jgi:4,5:9,10-diseco-3-hydroxy-5,9,17-trioxoandrosta-1(10),2-diene-4-oate hydrolase